jgi:hypothetical protein
MGSYFIHYRRGRSLGFVPLSSQPFVNAAELRSWAIARGYTGTARVFHGNRIILEAKL